MGVMFEPTGYFREGEFCGLIHEGDDYFPVNLVTDFDHVKWIVCNDEGTRLFRITITNGDYEVEEVFDEF